MRKAFVLIASLLICAVPNLALTSGAVRLLNAGLFGLFGGHQQPPAGWFLHKQHVDVGDLRFKPAERQCENWSWVAAIVDMAETGGAHLDQQYLIDRLYGGSVCLNSAGNLEEMAQRISHDYVLADGHKFRLEAKFTPGAPSQPDPLILAVRQLRPVMLVWRNHGYLLTGVDYDEYVSANNSKMFIVTALTLFDPQAPEGKADVTFTRDSDNPDDLNGVLELSVYTK